MVSELLQKYIWLVRTFVREGDRGLSLEEICGKWESRWGSPYSRRTFNNHREAVEDVFGIRIECNRSTMRYFVRYSEDVKDENADAAWLINTFTVNNLLSLGKERLSGRVSVEDIPSGQKYLTVLIEAMLDNKEIEIGYKKYTVRDVETVKLRPYALKEFAKRWYIIGYSVDRKSLRVYGLDRILSIDVLETGFSLPEGFDVDELLAPAFGIYLPAGKEPVDIVFSATDKEAKYLRDLPIHHSQKETTGPAAGDRSVFNIRVVPDTDLIMELCRRGDRIEVIAPEEIRRQVALEFRKAAAIYGDVADNC